MTDTEKPSSYDHLEQMTTEEILCAINHEDTTVPTAVKKCIPQIMKLVDAIVERMRKGGRVFYIGAGTSGRLGIIDASEIPPTYGVRDKFIGIIAGGDTALRNAIEGAEDNPEQGWRDMMAYHPTAEDTLIGISASGGAAYVVGALRQARQAGMLTSIISSSSGSLASTVCEIPIECIVGPEFVTGSTRMKSGTAAKLIVNMISTTVMIRLGHVRGNHMVDMQLTNSKLVDRGTRMIMLETGLEDYDTARSLLLEYGSVRAAVEALKQKG
jgi:N-acetylmuramic acid 6-phosphate etherase